jgi:hypothetical protein
MARTPITEQVAEESSSSKSKPKKSPAEAFGIRSSLKIHGPWDIIEYKIPGENGESIGFVRHFKSNGIINQQVDGPNDLFLQMQSGELNLRRNPARQPGCEYFWWFTYRYSG